ncbi:MAG: sugar ABC transporter permease [Cellulomonas sp.]|uniref:Alpha-glucoside ABC transporter permease n=1 Tax=Cellulomonas gelida TaxID=1712 RepID=A0A4Y3KMS5_9CELL|nr:MULTISPECIES: sugar ABC transporter permease [Cellulomonas]KMM45641.1 ABC transporter permease [Cellulomonas sp. A375-1]MCR6649364.1 sugar ABC transporter permease [Cellulomonas sp.]MCR6705343.1 sugar ABC transporter permease [Cellulomonas sp.]GEA85342.1 alpha-glucoside ABC transporter permease [Cellulomonas gelida]GGL18834.1 alpha-glucoside ABC transporter permease [Cellulomonas gelida]
MEAADKLVGMVVALVAFAVVIGVILLVVHLLERRGARRVAWWFIGPTILLIAIGLVYPALRTVWRSFYDAAGTAFIGLGNYTDIFTSGEQLVVLRNTVLWVLVTPFVATVVGLIYAILVDGAKGEAAAKALIFLPMAISFVGASIIWKFMYEYRFYDPSVENNPNQIGFINQIIVWLGGSPQNFLLNSPWNNFFLIAVMIWIQAGFAMTILSAAIKAIPTEITEAARLDGVSSTQLFRFVTVPSIRPTLIVVLTTIAIGCLKVFDIVRTMTAGRYGTSVVANEFYTQSFSAGNQGLGAALAVLLFVLVVPIIVYNVHHLRKANR